MRARALKQTERGFHKGKELRKLIQILNDSEKEI
jgi:hypothetical protein